MDIFNIIPKDAENNGFCSRTQEVLAVPNKFSAPMTHWFHTIQCQQKTPAPRVKVTP